MTRALDDTALDTLFREAHTTYAFSDEPVSDTELEQLYHLVKLGPTLMNSQPLRIAFVRSPEAKTRLLPLLNEGNRPKSESAPAVAIVAADVDFHEHLPRVAPHAEGARERFEAHPNREQVARLSTGLQAGYLIVAARALGLDAGPMGGFDGPGIDAEFFPGTALRTMLVVNLGHAAEDGQRPRAPRLDLDEAVSFL